MNAATMRRRMKRRKLRMRMGMGMADMAKPTTAPEGLALREAEALVESIHKVKGGYRIISHRTGKNLGTYKTRAQAERALARMARFREGSERIGDCRYITIGGRRTCMTGGHNHSARLLAGQGRTLYYGASQPGRRRRRHLAQIAAAQPPTPT